ncbi:DUF2127 domain-containing protein [Candidatus Pacearchaeota archaeon]|nr:DUF2127 domain-containing protein [Candidatus Pacearchaeota archaeon]
MLLKERKLQTLFKIGIIYKGITAVLELIAGTLLLFISQNTITRAVISLTQEEIAEDSRDFIANHLLQAASYLSLSIKIFIALYLIAHGIVKLYLMYGLIKKRQSAYPISIAFFTIFLLYEFYRYELNHSAWLIVLMILDVIFISLLLHEYRRINP